MSAQAALSLAQLQERLQSAIMPPTPAGGLAPLALDAASADLLRSGRASADERLQVYVDAYLARLEECLADDYGGLKYALGAEAFSRLCTDYVRQYPSTHPSLNGFGAHLPKFLCDQPCGLGMFAFYLARLEWAIVEVLHAKAGEPSAMARVLGTLSGQDLVSVRFVPSDAVRLLFSGYPVNAYLQNFLDGLEPSIPLAGPCATLVVRSGYRLRRFELEAAQVRVLQQLLAGEPLGVALAGAEASESAVGTWFQSWTEAGVFASVVAPSGVIACD